MHLSDIVLTGEITMPFNGIDGKDGKDGAAGKSAYEIACEHGYEGTEKEWVESLGFIPDGTIGEIKLTDEAKERLEWKENKGQPSGYAPLDEFGKIPEGYLYGTAVKEFGIRWLGRSDSGCERLGDAENLVANACLGSNYDVKNDFDSIYPWCDMKLCNIDSEGNVAAYFGEPNFARDGSMGDVMVEIPRFYYKRNKTADGCEEWWICGVKLPGYKLHPVFLNGDDEVSRVYHSAYNASREGEALLSITGAAPLNQVTRKKFREYAKNKGNGWSVEDVSMLNALQLLYAIEYGNLNSQQMLGKGAVQLRYFLADKVIEAGENTNSLVVSVDSANGFLVGQLIEFGATLGSGDVSGTTRRITAIEGGVITFDGESVSVPKDTIVWNNIPENGGCDTLNGKSGYVGLNGYADISYRGIEGFHGKMYRFIDGINVRDYVAYVSDNVDDFADGVYEGSYAPLCYTNATENGFAIEMGYDKNRDWVMLPVKTGGSSATYYCDNYTQNIGDRIMIYGGNISQTNNAGAFCTSLTNTEGTKSYYYGAHLMLKKR